MFSVGMLMTVDVALRAVVVTILTPGKLQSLARLVPILLTPAFGIISLGNPLSGTFISLSKLALNLLALRPNTREEDIPAILLITLLAKWHVRQLGITKTPLAPVNKLPLLLHSRHKAPKPRNRTFAPVQTALPLTLRVIPLTALPACLLWQSTGSRSNRLLTLTR